MDGGWRTLAVAVCAGLFLAGLLVLLTGCADECAHLYSAPGGAAVSAYKAAEREGM